MSVYTTPTCHAYSIAIAHTEDNIFSILDCGLKADDNIQTPGHYDALTSMAKSGAAENPATVEVNARVAENPKTSLQQMHAILMCCIVHR